MKKALLPLAVASLMPATVLAVGPIDGDVYGKINLSVEAIDDSVANEDTTELVSNASRFGVAGKTELTEGLYAIYKIEWEVGIDDGSTDLGSRNRYLGLAGGFGSLIAGQHDTPHKLAQNKVDLFSDLVGDIKNNLDSENRAPNIVMFTSPALGDMITVSGAWVASEDDDADDGASLSVAYDQSGLYLAAAYESDVEAQGTDSTRLVAQYNAGSLQLGALWEENDVDGLDKQDAYHLSVAYKIDKITLKTQYTQSEIGGSAIVSSIDGDEGDLWSLGADYKLAKSTKLFAYYTTWENDEDTTDLDVFGVGMEHKF